MARTPGMPLVGRVPELARLGAAFDRLRGGSGGVILLEGEAGIGKTRILRAAVEEAERAGFRVVVGAARELETERPFGAISEALDLPRASDEATAPIRDLLDDPRRDVRFQVSDLVADLLEAWAEGGGVVLALEDIHWADASTLLVLDRVGRLAPTIRLLVLATARPIPRSHDLLVTLGAVEPEVIALGPLEEDETRELAAGSLGAPPSEGLMAQLRSAAGNPLFETEMIAALREEGSIVIDGGVADATDDGLPPSLQLTILRRVAFLPDETLDALRIASIFGSTFAVEPVAVVSGLSAAELLGSLKAALDAGIVSSRGTTFAFRHDLVRDAVYGDVPEAIRTTLHRAAGRALLQLGAPAIEAARQVLLGARPGDREDVDILVRAASEAEGTSPASQIEFLRAALQLLGPASNERAPLLADLSVALFLVGGWEEGESASLEVLSSSGLDPATEIRAAWGLMYAYAGQCRDHDAIAHLERFLSERELPPREEVRLRLSLAQARLTVLDVPGAEGDLREALPTLEGLDDEAVRANELIVRANILLLKGRSAEALEVADRAVVEARASQEWDEMGSALWARADSLRDLDRLEDALATWGEVGRLMELATGFTHRVHSHLAWLEMLAGAWDEMEGDLLAAESAARDLSRSPVTDVTGWLRALLAFHRNDMVATRAELHAADVEHRPRITQWQPGRGYPFWSWIVALVEEAEGRPDTALEQLVEARRATDVILTDTPQWAPDGVRIALKAGDRAAAERFADLAATAAEPMGTPSARSAALRCRGLVERDAELLRQAVEVGRESPRPLDRALTMEDAGRVVPKEEAIPLLAGSLEILEGLGAERHARRVGALLRRHGVRPAAPRVVRATSGWDSLTRGERRVAELVAEGLRNRQIAERLFLSVRTVESHVSRALTKLGVTSRVAMAAIAHDRADGA